MYLYGIRFTCVVDLEPLVPLYNFHSRELQARVARHRSKLTGFNFKVIYKLGTTYHSDYGYRHQVQGRSYSNLEKEQCGIKMKEEDVKVMVAQMEELT